MEAKWRTHREIYSPPGTVKGGGATERDKQAAIAEVRAIFERLKRVLKQIALYRHMKERYSEIREPVYLALVDFLKRHGTLSLKVEALGFNMKARWSSKMTIAKTTWSILFGKWAFDCSCSKKV